MKNIFTVLTLLTTLFVPLKIFGHNLTVDPNYSPHSSAKTFLFLNQQIIDLPSKFQPKPQSIDPTSSTHTLLSSQEPINLLSNAYFPETWKGKTLAGCLRTLELSLVWQPLHVLATVTQHEVFGHGYRARAIGTSKVTVTGYNMRFGLTPYGFNMKEASTKLRYTSQITPTERLALTIGGAEANSILAHNVFMYWLADDKIDGRQTSLLSYSYLDLYSYIFSLKKSDEISALELFERERATFDSYHSNYAALNPTGPRILALADTGHDIAAYLTMLNTTYSESRTIEEQARSLEVGAVASTLLHPCVYLASYAQLRYIVTGKPTTPFGLLNGSFKLLPAYRLGLTPFGPENIYEIYYWGKELSPGCVYFKEGSFSFNKYYGCGFENNNFIQTKLGSFGFKLDLWVQPKVLQKPFAANAFVTLDPQYPNNWRTTEYFIRGNSTGLSERELYTSRFGGSLSLIYQYQLQEPIFKNIWLQLGYKTQGYLPGENLRQSPIVRLGANLTF